MSRRRLDSDYAGRHPPDPDIIHSSTVQVPMLPYYAFAILQKTCRVVPAMAIFMPSRSARRKKEYAR